MTKLFVANCTKQKQEFLYRVPGISRESPFRSEIHVGQCVQVYNDEASDVLDAIIAQHADYGLIHVDEIDRTKDFIGMCYQFNSPINVDAIMRALSHNDEVLQERGVELRKQAAVAISGQAEQTALEVGAGQLKSMEVTFEEVAGPGGETPKINEVVEVVKEGVAPRSRSRKE